MKKQDFVKFDCGTVAEVERNEIEATFGTGKRIYRANDIRAKLQIGRAHV